MLCAVSGATNYLFLSSLGKTPLEGQVLGAASAAADLLKALLPFFVAWSWQNRRVVATLAGSLAFGFFAGFSFLSAIGFAADNRGVLVEARDSKNAEYQRVQREVSETDRRFAGLPAYRPPSVVAEEIERHRQNRRWGTTKECAEATESQSRDFCSAYFALRAELANGEEAARLASVSANLQSQAQHLRESGAGQDRDPQVALLSRIFGQAPEPVRLALIIAVALLVEIGASLGLFLASGHSGTTRAKPEMAARSAPDPATSRPPGSVEDFCLEALAPAKGGALALSDLFPAYQAWCAGQGFAALAEADFVTTFERLARDVGLGLEEGSFCGIAIAMRANEKRLAA